MTFREWIQTWVKNVVEEIKRLGPLWFVLVLGWFIKELVLDRVTGSVNTWLDDNAPEVVKFVKAHMPLFPQSELGLVGWMFFLTILFILVRAYRDTRQSYHKAAPVIRKVQEGGDSSVSEVGKVRGGRWGLGIASGLGLIVGILLTALFFRIGAPIRPHVQPLEVSALKRGAIPVLTPPVSAGRSEQGENYKAASAEAKGPRRTSQEFTSLLQDFPSGDSVSALSQLVVSQKRIVIRANKSSYEQAKVFEQWFKDAQWEVVEVADTLVDNFPDGITVSAPYNNGDAENIHVALCKLGYKVSREAPYSYGSMLSIERLEFITLKIGDLSQK